MKWNSFQVLFTYKYILKFFQLCNCVHYFLLMYLYCIYINICIKLKPKHLGKSNFCGKGNFLVLIYFVSIIFISCYTILFNTKVLSVFNDDIHHTLQTSMPRDNKIQSRILFPIVEKSVEKKESTKRIIKLNWNLS